MFHSRTFACLTVTLAFVWLAGGTGQTQGVRRQGGPLDWSHARIVESRRPNGNRTLARNWRSYRKQVRMDAARGDAMRAGSLASTAMLPPPAPTGLRIVIPGAPVITTPSGPGPAPLANGAELDWNLRTGGYGPVLGYPAKYNFDIAASNCSDVMYFTVDQAAGAGSIVNVIAITNSYAGCSGNVNGQTPTVKFGVRMGTGTATSPVPSLDGKTLYVFESRSLANGGLVLHAINVDNIISNVGNYNFNTNVWSNAHVLPAPTGGASSEQKFQLTYATVTNNVSSPFLDYSTDQLFFGDSSGRVHRVANVNSTAAAKDTTNFPVACGTQPLQSPVYVNGQIIVTSADGKLYRIDTTQPAPYTCVSTVQVGDGVTAGGGLSAPMIDVTNGKIVVATNNDPYYNLRGVVAFNLMFAANEVPGAQVSTGPGRTAIAPTAPTFDNDFWTTNSGNLYAAGGPTTGEGTYLVRVAYSAGVFGMTLGYAALTRSGPTAATVATSPPTEFLTASSLSNPDFLYIGGSAGAYTYLNRISSKFNGTVTSPVSMAGSFAVTGGISSGISIDTRTAAMTGTTATANVYFGTLGVASTRQSTIVQLAQQF
jgi:hypothetical protein